MEKLKTVLITIFIHKRMKALYWSVGAMAVPVLGDVLIETLTTVDVPNWITVGLGLLIAQLTKYLNTKKTI